MQYPRWMLISLVYEFDCEYVNGSDLTHDGYGESAEHELEYQYWLLLSGPPIDDPPGHTFVVDFEDEWVSSLYQLVQVIHFI